LQEGISYEAMSLAGTQELGNLIYLYDENRISIEDDIEIAFTEDIRARFESQGWHYQEVSWLQDDGSYVENLEALFAAFENAKAETRKPSIIKLRTIIGWPSPNKQNQGGIHGSALGASELEGLKAALGLDPTKMFDIPAEIVAATRENVAKRAQAFRSEWDPRFATWQQSHPQQAALLKRLQDGKLPADVESALPQFEPGSAIATRAASGKVINALAGVLPELWGGSADLAGSNNTAIADESSFAPADRATKAWTNVSEWGRNLHFGVREHAMAGILNGIATSGLTRPYAGTFLVFSDFMRGAVRLSALMKLPVTYVWTHDSIGVGEDGPTHQPVETLTSLRAIPNLAVVRPADGAETAYAWLEIMRRRGPAGLALSRQKLPNPARGADTGLASAKNVARGGYVLKDFGDNPAVILLATGSEVALALQAGEKLAEEGVVARVVSLPCLEWFEEQDAAYRESVLPASIRARVSIEAGLAMPWYRYLGDAGTAVSVETFGTP
ncbi:transketolase, partial [Mobiluncus curtisii]